jgi:hypothetical protein
MLCLCFHCPNFLIRVVHMCSWQSPPESMSKFVTDDSLSISVDPRSHLEVYDPKHRYGKNLRVYFKHFMTNVKNTTVGKYESPRLSDKVDLFSEFFSWLDGCHEVSFRSNASNDALVIINFNFHSQVHGCSRQDLETEVVSYLDDDEARRKYIIDIDENGLFWQRRSNNSAAEVCGDRRLLTTEDGNPYIFVIRGRTLFAGEKITKSTPRYEHG